MTSRLVYRQITVCDWCGRKHIAEDEDGEVEGKLPKGWVELTKNEDSSMRGSEELFADICPKCVPKVPFKFHDNTNEIEQEATP